VILIGKSAMSGVQNGHFSSFLIRNVVCLFILTNCTEIFYKALGNATFDYSNEKSVNKVNNKSVHISLGEET
jgi:hypothetical protein